MYATLSNTPSRSLSGLGHADCHCGGSCCKDKGLGRGVQEYLPVSPNMEFAAYSVGGMIPPVGMGDLYDASGPGLGTLALIAGGVLLVMSMKSASRRRRSAAAVRRVRGY